MKELDRKLLLSVIKEKIKFPFGDGEGERALSGLKKNVAKWAWDGYKRNVEVALKDDWREIDTLAIWLINEHVFFQAETVFPKTLIVVAVEEVLDEMENDP